MGSFLFDAFSPNTGWAVQLLVAPRIQESEVPGSIPHQDTTFVSPADSRGGVVSYRRK